MSNKCSCMEPLRNLEQDLKVSIRSVETYLQQPDLLPENRAELRGRWQAYTNDLSKVKTVICQVLRRDKGSHIEAALDHVEAAAYLVAELEAEGYLAEYKTRNALRKLLDSDGAKSAIIGIWGANIKERSG